MEIRYQNIETKLTKPTGVVFSYRDIRRYERLLLNPEIDVQFLAQVGIDMYVGPCPEFSHRTSRCRNGQIFCTAVHGCDPSIRPRMR